MPTRNADGFGSAKKAEKLGMAAGPTGMRHHTQNADDLGPAGRKSFGLCLLGALAPVPVFVTYGYTTWGQLRVPSTVGIRIAQTSINAGPFRRCPAIRHRDPSPIG